MGKKIKSSDESIFAMFGIDLEAGTVAPKGRKGDRTMGALGKWWSGRTDPEKAGLVAGGVGLVSGVLGTLLLSHAVNGGATNAPAPLAPSSATAHPGARLVVKTPRGQGGIARKSPGTGSAPIGTVNEGAVVTVEDAAMLGRTRWYKVASTAGEGWMSSDILVSSPKAGA